MKITYQGEIREFADGMNALDMAGEIDKELKKAALAARGVHIISSRDISAPHLESRAFGLYHEQDGVIANLAMPIWNWGKLYEGIVRSILTGAWNDEGEHNADRAMNYYMGTVSYTHLTLPTIA